MPPQPLLALPLMETANFFFALAAMSSNLLLLITDANDANTINHANINIKCSFCLLRSQIMQDGWL